MKRTSLWFGAPTKGTGSREFVDEMDRVVQLTVLVALVEPHMP